MSKLIYRMFFVEVDGEVRWFQFRDLKEMGEGLTRLGAIQGGEEPEQGECIGGWDVSANKHFQTAKVEPGIYTQEMRLMHEGVDGE